MEEKKSGLYSLGLNGSTKVHWNLSPAELVEQAIIRGEGSLCDNGALAADAGSFHRSLCIDYLYYNKDGTIKRVVMTSEGVSEVK